MIGRCDHDDYNVHRVTRRHRRRFESARGTLFRFVRLERDPESISCVPYPRSASASQSPDSSLRYICLPLLSPLLHSWLWISFNVLYIDTSNLRTDLSY